MSARRLPFAQVRRIADQLGIDPMGFSTQEQRMLLALLPTARLVPTDTLQQAVGGTPVARVAVTIRKKLGTKWHIANVGGKGYVLVQFHQDGER